MSQLLKEVRAFLQELAEQAPPYGEIVAMTGPMAIGSKARRLLQLANDASLDEEATVERLPVWRADAEWHDDVLVVKADLYDAHIAELKVELAEVREVLGGMLNSRNACQWECERLTESLTNMQAQRDLIAEHLRFERGLWAGNPKAFPFNPTEAQWGGLARDIVDWMRTYPSHRHTPATLVEHLKDLGREVPVWMGSETEMLAEEHVLSKGTVAALIYKAMLADYRGTE